MRCPDGNTLCVLGRIIPMKDYYGLVTFIENPSFVVNSETLHIQPRSVIVGSPNYIFLEVI